MFAERMDRIEGSGVRKMFELISTMEDPINLSIGQADYDAPAEVKDAAIAAIREGQNRYTVTQGIPSLNEAVQAKLASDYGVRPESVFTTSGVSGGLLLSMLALVNPGDEVLIPDPYFVMYKNVLALVGAVPVYYDLYPTPDKPAWSPRIEEIEEKLSEKTKILLLNSPSNPTGGVLSGDELDRICELVEPYGTWILSDEIYEHFVYDEAYASLVTRMPRWKRSLVLGGHSKTYGVPGWRLGWAAGPEDLIDQMRLLQQYTFVCAPAPLQAGGLAALELDMSQYRESYRKKRDMIYEGLRGTYEILPSRGSFYAFVAYPEGIPEKDFVPKTLERKLLIVPGSAFSRRDTHFRLSFAASEETLERGIEALIQIAKG